MTPSIGDSNDRAFLLSVSGGSVRWRDIIPPGRVPAAGRGDIVAFSNGAAGRMRRYLSSCDAMYRNMVTLTYPAGYPLDGRTCKDHLRRFIQESRRFLFGRSATAKQVLNLGFSVFWFLEFQERGAPHFHLFGTHDLPKEWVSHTWWRIVGSDDIRHLHAGTRIERLRGGRSGSVAYAVKYAVKLAQKVVPEWFRNVGRFWGVSGLRSCVAAATVVHPDRLDSRATGALEKIKDRLRAMAKDGAATMIRGWDGKYSGAYVRNIDDQRELARAVMIFAARASACGGMLRWLEPLDAYDELGVLDEFR